MTDDLDPSELMRFSDDLNGLLAVATGQREKALAEGYSPTAAEAIALQAHQLASARHMVQSSATWVGMPQARFGRVHNQFARI